MSSKRKQSERSYEEKAAIIHYCDKNPTMKKKDIAAHFEIAHSTLTGLLKNRDKVLTTCSAENKRIDAKGSKRIRSITHPDVDEALVTWFRQKSMIADVRLDGGMLPIQANKFRLMFNANDNDVISMSWIERFKQRYGIVKVKKSGESAGVDQEIVRTWKEGKLSEILTTYEPAAGKCSQTIRLVLLGRITMDPKSRKPG